MLKVLVVHMWYLGCSLQLPAVDFKSISLVPDMSANERVEKKVETAISVMPTINVTRHVILTGRDCDDSPRWLTAAQVDFLANSFQFSAYFRALRGDPALFLDQAMVGLTRRGTPSTLLDMTEKTDYQKEIHLVKSQSIREERVFNIPSLLRYWLRSCHTYTNNSSDTN